MKYTVSELTPFPPAFSGKPPAICSTSALRLSTVDFQIPSVSPLSTAFTPNRLLSSLSTVFTYFDRGVGGSEAKKSGSRRREKQIPHTAKMRRVRNDNA